MKHENEICLIKNQRLNEEKSGSVAGYHAGINGFKKSLFTDKDQSANYLKGYAQGHRKGYKIFLAVSFIEQQRIVKDAPEFGGDSKVTESAEYCEQSPQYPADYFASNNKRKERPGADPNLNAWDPKLTQPMKEIPLKNAYETIEPVSVCDQAKIHEEKFNLNAMSSHTLSQYLSLLRSYNDSIENSLSYWANLSPLLIEQTQKLLKQACASKVGTVETVLYEVSAPQNSNSQRSSFVEPDFGSTNIHASPPSLDSWSSDMIPQYPSQQEMRDFMSFFNNVGELPQENSHQYDELYCRTSEIEKR